jgi:hypothetical protein
MSHGCGRKTLNDKINMNTEKSTTITNQLLIPLWLIAAALNKGVAEWSCLSVALLVAILALVDTILEWKKIKQPNGLHEPQAPRP